LGNNLPCIFPLFEGGRTSASAISWPELLIVFHFRVTRLVSGSLQASLVSASTTKLRAIIVRNAAVRLWRISPGDQSIGATASHLQSQPVGWPPPSPGSMRGAKTCHPTMANGKSCVNDGRYETERKARSCSQQARCCGVERWQSVGM
jgi:hypothetical protein